MSRRLDELRDMVRVWPRDHPNHDRANLTGGLIELCEEWVKPKPCRPGFLMAEVGCFAGVSTEIFAHFAWKVYAVDAWTLCPGYEETDAPMLGEAVVQFLRMARHYPQIELIPYPSAVAAAEIPDRTLDAVYLDGEHCAIAADIALWEPKLTRGGLLMGHDLDQIGLVLAELGIRVAKEYAETSWVAYGRSIASGV